MRLFGHDLAVADFRNAMKSEKLHHAWLLTGPKGIGKRTFAEMAATRVLAEGTGSILPGDDLTTPSDHPTAQLLAAHSHPDFRLLQRPAKDKKERAKPLNERDPDADLARNIPIDLIRELQSLFNTTPSMSSWRAIIIDSADDLERSAANALLKNLEEPPSNTVFLLVSHSPGKLLPTIRSRCRTLRFQALSHAAMRDALGQAEPDIDTDELSALVELGDGSPGQALRYLGQDIADLDAQIASLIANGDAGNAIRAELAKSLSLKASKDRYAMFLERAPAAIATHAKTLEGRALSHAIENWENSRALAASAPRISLDPQSTVFALAGMLASLHEPTHG